MFTNVSDEYSTGRRKWIGCPPVSKRAGGRKEEREGEAGKDGKYCTAQFIFLISWDIQKFETTLNYFRSF